jgi:hypothetical protein
MGRAAPTADGPAPVRNRRAPGSWRPFSSNILETGFFSFFLHFPFFFSQKYVVRKKIAKLYI